MVKRPLPVHLFQFPSLRDAQRFQKDAAERGLESIRASTGDGFYVVAVREMVKASRPAPKDNR